MKKIFIFLGYFFIALATSLFLHANLSLSFFVYSFIYSSILTIISLINKKVFIVTYILMIVISFIQIFYYKVLFVPFSFIDMTYSSEGLSYFSALFEVISINMILYLLLLIILFIYLLKNYDTNLKYKYYILLGLIILNSLYFFLLPDKNTYKRFDNRKECFNIMGLYEYSVRDLYLIVKDNFFFDKKGASKTIKKYIKNNNRKLEKNEYTGLLKDDNVIVVLMESTDSWMIDDMETLSYMKKTGLNFTNRYAPAFGSGRTFNSEFSINTGYYVPTNSFNIFKVKNYNFSNSLANSFKKNDYDVNSIHFNNGSFYNREAMHKAYGYNKHYSLYDMGYDEKVTNDGYLTENEDIYKLIVKDDKFLSYVVTYSLHLPYNSFNELCDDEENCLSVLEKDADDFYKNLLEKLERDKKLDNTTIILVSDHYAYGYDSKEIEKYKGSLSYEDVERVPFIIWSKKLENKNIDTYLDTSDILPTILNLFGIDYDPNVYIGTDVFSKYHKDMVYFNDYSYLSKDYKNYEKLVKDEININNLIVKSNYFN